MSPSGIPACETPERQTESCCRLWQKTQKKKKRPKNKVEVWKHTPGDIFDDKGTEKGKADVKTFSIKLVCP